MKIGVPDVETQEVLSVLYDLPIKDCFYVDIPNSINLECGNNILSNELGGQGLTVQKASGKIRLSTMPYDLLVSLPTCEKRFDVCPLKRRITQDKEVETNLSIIGIATDGIVRIENEKQYCPKQFGTSTVANLSELIKENLFLYELVPEESHIRLFFDIEWEVKKSSSLDTERFATIINHINSALEHLTGTSHTLNFTTTASRFISDGYKNSFHVHYPTVCFENITHLHEFMYLIMRHLHTAEDKDYLFQDGLPVIDWCVYNKWRNMRLPFQSGANKYCRLLPVNDDQFKIDNYLITINDTSPEYNIVPVDISVHHTLSRDIAIKTSYPYVEPVSPVSINAKQINTISNNILSPHTPVFIEDSEIGILLSYIPASCDYTMWRNVGFALKNINEAFSTFNTWSASAPASYGGERECLRFWASIKPRDKQGFTIESIRRWARFYSPQCFEVVKPSSPFSDFEDVKHNYNTIRSEGQYISPIDATTRIVLLHAGMGCGKTHQIKQFIKKHDCKRVLVIAPRITYAIAVAGDLEELGFINYHTEKGILTYDRIVCSIESLHRLEKLNFDLIVCDEIETILTSITSPTNANNFEINTTTFKQIFCNKKTRVIGGDAFLSQRTFDFFNSISPEVGTLYVHTKQYISKRMTQFKKETDFIYVFEQAVLDGEKIYMVSLSKKFIRRLEVFLKEHNITYLIYHQDVSKKRKQTLIDVETNWTKVQVVLTSPTISIGIDQSTLYFDRRMMYTIAGSASARDCTQALWRVRQTTQNDDYWHHNNNSHASDLCGEPTTYKALLKFFLENLWLKLPNLIISEHDIRCLYTWNKLETNINYIHFEEWLTSYLHKLNFRIEKIENSSFKSETTASSSPSYNEIKSITSGEVEKIKLRMKQGSNNEITSCDRNSLKKHKFDKLIREYEPMDIVEVDDLWKYCENGNNLKPLEFYNRKYNPEFKVKNIKSRDITANYTNIQYEAIQEIMTKLPELHTKLEGKVLDNIEFYFMANIDYLRKIAHVNSRGGNNHFIRSFNGILKKFTFLQCEPVGWKGKQKVYAIEPKFEHITEHIKKSFEKLDLTECVIESENI